MYNTFFWKSREVFPGGFGRQGTDSSSKTQDAHSDGTTQAIFAIPHSLCVVHVIAYAWYTS